MPEESRSERNTRLQHEVDAITRRLEEISRELGEETPQERRRRFILLPGGLAGIAAIAAATPAWARTHGRQVVGYVASAAGGAAITAAALSHPAGEPHAAPQPPPATPAPTAVSISPTPSPANTPARRRGAPLPPPVIIPTPRRSGGAPSPAPTPAAPPGPPLPSTTPQPSPSAPPSSTCLILVEVRGIIHVCV